MGRSAVFVPLQVEILGVLLGCCQLVFVPVAFAAVSDSAGGWGAVLPEGFGDWRFGSSDWVMLLAANVGAVIMPWMLFYQQSAICEKLAEANFQEEEELTVATEREQSVG